MLLVPDASGELVPNNRGSFHSYKIVLLKLPISLEEKIILKYMLLYNIQKKAEYVRKRG